MCSTVFRQQCAGIVLTMLVVLPTPLHAAPPGASALIRPTGLSAEGQIQLAHNLVEQALAFEHGEGAPKDPEQAAKLYCDAARYGNAEAQYNLGWMYANGRGVDRHEGYAATLFSMAAAQGHEGARAALRFVGQPSGDQPDCLDPAKIAQRADTRSQSEEAPNFDGEDLDEYIAGLPPDKRRIADLIRLLAPQYKIQPRLALAIAVTESNLDVMARSSRGALGVMQLIPETAARFGVRRTFDPGQNIRGGLSYLRWLLAYYKGDVLLTAAAYNAGEGAVDRNRGIPPFMETVGYVKRILAFYKLPTHPYEASLVAVASPILSTVSSNTDCCK